MSSPSTASNNLFALTLADSIRQEKIYPLINYIPLKTLVNLTYLEMKRLGLIKKNGSSLDFSLLQKKQEEIKKKCQKENIKIITILDEDYPFYLKNIYNPPLVLYFQGELKKYIPEEGLYLSFIGSRKSDEEMNLTAEKIAYEFSNCGGHVISGLAKGIDAFSHKGACLAKKPTTAVVANGLDIYYPRGNKTLVKKILDNGGCIISEYPPGEKPLSYRFPLRNRIIAGLSEGIFVIQSPQKSGTKITVNYGIENGKNIYSYANFSSENLGEKFVGNHELIEAGATPIYSVNDFFVKISSSFSFKLLKNTEGFLKDPTQEIPLKDDKKKVMPPKTLKEKLMSLIQEKPQSLTELSRNLKIETNVLSREILELLFEQKIVELSNKKFFHCHYHQN